MGVASGCGEKEVGVASGSGWNLWVWLLGVVVRRYIDFLILLIPTPLVSVLFCSSIPTCCSFLNVFRSLYIYIGRILHSSTVSVGLAQARPNYSSVAGLETSHVRALKRVLRHAGTPRYAFDTCIRRTAGEKDRRRVAFRRAEGNIRYFYCISYGVKSISCRLITITIV